MAVRGASYAANGSNYAGYATPQDLIALENPAGSGKILRLALFRLQIASTAGGELATLNFIRRTPFATGGTSTLAQRSKLDSAQPASVGLVRTFNTAPTPGGVAEVLALVRNKAAIITDPGLVFEFGESLAISDSVISPLVARPGESIAANFGAAALPAGFLVQAWRVAWTESDIGS